MEDRAAAKAREIVVFHGRFGSEMTTLIKGDPAHCRDP